MDGRYEKSFHHRTLSEVGAPAQRTERLAHIVRGGMSRLLRGKQDDVVALQGKAAGRGRGPQNTLGAVSIHRISQSFSSNEGDPTRIAFV